MFKKKILKSYKKGRKLHNNDTELTVFYFLCPRFRNMQIFRLEMLFSFNNSQAIKNVISKHVMSLRDPWRMRGLYSDYFSGLNTGTNLGLS